MFSFAWFGWAQENPRQHWRKYIGVASLVSLVVCMIGIYLSVKHWHAASALSDTRSFKLYLVIFYTEFIVATIGSFFLIKFKKKQFVAPWICFVVSAHFFLLALIFKDNSLYILSLLMIIISLCSPTLAKRFHVTYSAITGIGSGIVLLCFAILGLVQFILV